MIIKARIKQERIYMYFSLIFRKFLHGILVNQLAIVLSVNDTSLIIGICICDVYCHEEI